MEESPQLSEKGKEEAKQLLQAFCKEMVLKAEDALSDLYAEWLPHVETDAWMNYRRDIFKELTNYGESKKIRTHDWRQVRKVILEENREEIIADLNQDHINRIEELEAQIAVMNDFRNFHP